MSARIAHIRSPVAPAIGLRSADVAPGVVLTRAIVDAEWKLPGNTFLLRRGVLDSEIDWANVLPPDIFVKRSEWDIEPLDDGETRVFITLPQNGGGGGGGSQIAAIVAQIVLLVVAIIVAPYLAPGLVALGVGLTTATATALSAGAILVAGSLIISAILPAQQPKSFSTNQTSPSYSLTPQSNQARLGAAVPEWFGKYNQVPDLRAQPYVLYSEKMQSVYELFCLGKGEYEIEQMRIGTNVIAHLVSGVLTSTGTYPEISWEIAGPGETLHLFPDNVVTSTEVSGIELLGTNQEDHEATAWFVANPPGTKTTRIITDMALPAGLYHQTQSGNLDRAEVDFNVWARPIDDVGNPTGPSILIAEVHLHFAAFFPVRWTGTHTVTAGRYEVAMERKNAKGTSTSIADTLIWVALSAHLPNYETYGDCTMIAIQATATENLNGTSSDMFNVIATRKLSTPVLIGGVWQWSTDKLPTRSIGAAAYYLLTSVNNANLDPSRVDGNWLLSYEELWQDRGDTFDGGFDTQTTFWSMIQQVMNVGRAQALPGPLIGFVRDEPKTVYRCGFSARQMVKDTFSINYIFFDANTADAMLITYMDDSNYTWNTVFAQLPGSTLTEGTAPTTTAFGMTSRDQVWRTYMYMLAASCYRREFPQFDTELDGRVCTRGDLVKLSHVMPQWGTSADVVAIGEDAGIVLTLSEPWSIETDSPVVMVTSPDGYLAGPATVDIIDDGSISKRAQVRLTEACLPDQGLYDGEPITDWGLFGDDVRGLQRERPKCFLGSGEETIVDALVVAMKPQQGVKATMSCVVDNPAVYTADTGGPPDPPPYPPPDIFEDLNITNLTVREVALSISTEDTLAMCSITVSGAPDAVTFDYKTRYFDGGSWSPVTSGAGRSFTFRSGRGVIEVEVRGIGSSSIGDWFETDIDAAGHIEIFNQTFDFSRRANSGNWALFSAAWSP